MSLRTGTASVLGLGSLDCVVAGTVRVSPDGLLAAVSYHRAGPGGQTDAAYRVAVVDLAAGAVRADAAVVAPAPAGRVDIPKGPAGLAWADNTSVRVATSADREHTVRAIS